MAELTQQIAKQQDRVSRLLVRAPARGIVQELTKLSVGEVIVPGEQVAKIVPLSEGIVAEVRLDPRNVAHVKQGANVDMRLSAYDFNIYGIIKGVVSHISPTTFQNDENIPYYKVLVKLDKDHVSHAGRHHPILPGMVVQANIITGRKSLVKYLLKPVYRSVNTAFTER